MTEAIGALLMVAPAGEGMTGAAGMAAEVEVMAWEVVAREVEAMALVVGAMAKVAVGKEQEVVETATVAVAMVMASLAEEAEAGSFRTTAWRSR